MKRLIWTLALLIFPAVAAAGSLSQSLSQLPLPPKQSEKRYQLAATAMFQDEARFLREWIEYHHLLGVEHFYLYNNCSSDGYLEVLEPYLKSNLVELIDWCFPFENEAIHLNNQYAAYEDARFRANAEWLAILDIDEFFVPAHHNSLTELIADNSEPDVGGLIIQWVMFGTSHVEHIPEESLLIETLTLNDGPTWKGPLEGLLESVYYKSIVRVDSLIGTSVHRSHYLPGYRHKVLTTAEAQVNHYWPRDEEFLHTVKAERRQRWGWSVQCLLDSCSQLNRETEYHHSIQRFVPELRRRLNLPPR